MLELYYDSVNFWEDDEEPEQSDAIIIEEAVEVPDYALPIKIIWIKIKI